MLTWTVIDGLDLMWPKWTYEPAGSPLHIFYTAKTEYLAEHRDPIPQWSPATASGHDSWMGLFLYLEWAVALPILLFTVYRLGVQRKGTSGAHELALLALSVEVALTTLVCIHDVYYWDASYTAEAKLKLVTTMYSPWLIVRKLIGPPPPKESVLMADSDASIHRYGIEDPRPHQGSRCCIGG